MMDLENLKVGQDITTLTELQIHLVSGLRMKNQTLQKNMVVMRQCRFRDGKLYSPYSPQEWQWFLNRMVNSENGLYSCSELFFTYIESKEMNDLFSMSNIFTFIAVIPKGSYFYKGINENVSSSLVLLEKFNSIEDYYFVKKYVDRINRKNQTFYIEDYLECKHRSSKGKWSIITSLLNRILKTSLII